MSGNCTSDARRGVVFVAARHAVWCRAPFTQRSVDCCCNAEVAVVAPAEWLRGVGAANRAARRRAERAARRAGKTGGAR
jgi:hypothetical protein